MTAPAPDLVQAARERTNAIRASLAHAFDLIAESYRLRDWNTLGYQSWEAFCDTEFADVGQIRLPIEARRELVKVWTLDAGMTTRAISSVLKVSKSTAGSDRQALIEAGELDADAKVYSLDDKRRPLTRKKAEPVEEVKLSRGDEALMHLVRVGQMGLTSSELEKKARWTDRPGLGSGTLSRLHKRGCVVQTDVARSNRFPYVVTELCMSAHKHEGR